MKLTTAQCTARAEALEECADHLELNWTDDPVEREQGKIVGDQLRAQAKNWRDKAADGRK